MDERIESPNPPSLSGDTHRWTNTNPDPEASSDDAVGQDISYWICTFADASPLQLPVDRLTASAMSRTGCVDRIRLRFATALKKRLEQLAREQHVSPFAVLFVSWAILLARWCSQDDVVVGARWTRRLRDGELRVEGIDNPVPLRLCVEEHATVRSVLREADRVLAEAVAHSNVSMDDVHAAIRGGGDEAPLLRALIAFEDAAARATMKIRDKSEQSEPLSVDLALVIEEADGIWTGRLEYSKDLFDRDTIRRIADSYKTLLQAIVKHTSRPVGQLGLLTGAERNRVLYENNATAADYPRDKMIHELFETQAIRVPSAIALKCREDVLTYAQLNEHANQLARYLGRQGVARHDRVGICLERSIDLGVALLAVLKAGAAYVPLDRGDPSERLAYLLKDAAPTVVLTQSKLTDRLPPVQVLVIVLDALKETIAREDHRNLAQEKSNPEDLAYVTYTSGSTGQSQGVMVRHRNIVNYATYAVRRFEIKQGEGSLIGTSMSFDVAMASFYPPLLCGRAVTLCAQDEELEHALLSGRNYAPVSLTPTHLSRLSLRVKDIAGRIGTLVVGGDLLKGSAFKWWQEQSPATRLFNLYGPTEATSGCVVHEICDDIEGPVPIGKPIANTQIYVLNAYRSPAPVGVVGEIYIGGDAVAAGYWNRPELTVERFLRDPFSGDPNARMYKTGDLGRWRPDGTVEYLGRSKDQVKIRDGHAAVRHSAGAMYE